MDELKKKIMEMTGLDAAMADKIVGIVTNFIKENPDKLSGLVGEDEGVMGKIKGLFGRD